MYVYVYVKGEILIDQGSEDQFLHEKQLLPENFVKACEKVDHPVTLRTRPGVYVISISLSISLSLCVCVCVYVCVCES